MKDNIHPTYYDKAKITCACGNVIITGSTVPEMRIEICSHCHPFYTGKQKLVDSKGRITRFEKKLEQKTVVAATRIGRKLKRVTRAKKAQEQRDVEHVEQDQTPTDNS